MWIRRAFPVLAAIACLGASGYPAASDGASENSVYIDNFTFNPGEIAVPVGAKVVWTNRDDIPHTVASADGAAALHSAPLDSGDTFAFVFMKPGTFRYFCSIHPKMVGKIVVR